jgi:endonuclease-8
MPEGPECKIIAANLNQDFAGAQIFRVASNVYHPKADKDELQLEQIENHTIYRVRAYGKKIIFDFQDAPWHLMFGLGMTGDFHHENPRGEIKFAIETDAGALYFVDPRKMGYVSLHHHPWADWTPDALGIDLLTHPQSDAVVALAGFHKSSKSMANFLMDQACFPGVGNYLKSDICHVLGVSPTSKVKDGPPIEAIVKAASDLMHESFQSGGNYERATNSKYHPRPALGYNTKAYGKKQDAEGRHLHCYKLGGRVTYSVYPSCP